MAKKKRKRKAQTRTAKKKPSGGDDAGKPRARHRWRPGETGNPRGRLPDPVLAELRKAASEVFGPHTNEAIATILDLMRNAENERVRLSAAQEVVNRVYGKPTDKVEVTTPGQQPIPIRLSMVEATVPIVTDDSDDAADIV